MAFVARNSPSFEMGCTIPAPVVGHLYEHRIKMCLDKSNDKKIRNTNRDNVGSRRITGQRRSVYQVRVQAHPGMPGLPQKKIFNAPFLSGRFDHCRGSESIHLPSIVLESHHRACTTQCRICTRTLIQHSSRCAFQPGERYREVVASQVVIEQNLALDTLGIQDFQQTGCSL